jgi:ubiquitin-small subunit ribosomal protein S27Ae
MAEEKKKEHTKKSNYYDTSGELKRTRKFCAKCGPGIFMADHKDRYSCGNCGYMEKK